jgi:HPt (histidine-containing phosphotransfer) domain-containing protein
LKINAGAPGRSGEAVLDEEKFAELKELQDEENPTFLTDMIDLFGSEAPARRDEMRVALAARDERRLGMLAHRMKGSAANFGGQRLQAVSRELEKALHEGDWERAASGLAEPDRELEMLLAALELQKQRILL